MNTIGRQSNYLPTSVTFDITQDALPNGAYDAFYLSAFGTIYPEPSESDVSSGRVKRVIIDEAVASVTFTGLKQGIFYAVAGYRHDSSTVTRWDVDENGSTGWLGKGTPPYKPAFYTRPHLWPIDTLSHDWTKSHADLEFWQSEAGGMLPDAGLRDDIGTGSWLASPSWPGPVSPEGISEFATETQRTWATVSRVGWSTEEPFTVSGELAIHTHYEWVDDYYGGSVPDFAYGELNFFRAFGLMSGEEAYSNSDVLTLDQMMQQPQIETIDNTDGGPEDVTFDTQMGYGWKFNEPHAFSRTDPAYSSNPSPYKAGPFGAPQHMWVAALSFGPLRFQGHPYLASFSSHMSNWSAWAGDYNVCGGPEENSNTLGGLFPPIEDFDSQEWLYRTVGTATYPTQYPTGKLPKIGPWNATSPIFSIPADSAWTKIQYGGVSHPWSTLSVIVRDASTGDVLYTDTPTSTYSKRTIDLSALTSDDSIYLTIEGEHVGGTDVPRVGYLVVDAAESASTTPTYDDAAYIAWSEATGLHDIEVFLTPHIGYDLASAFLPPSLPISGHAGSTSGVSGTAYEKESVSAPGVGAVSGAAGAVTERESVAGSAGAVTGVSGAAGERESVSGSAGSAAYAIGEAAFADSSLAFDLAVAFLASVTSAGGSAGSETGVGGVVGESELAAGAAGSTAGVVGAVGEIESVSGYAGSTSGVIGRLVEPTAHLLPVSSSSRTRTRRSSARTARAVSIAVVERNRTESET